MNSLLRREHVDSVINIVTTLREVRELRFSVSQAAKGSLMVAGCAFLGGLLGGRNGLALGGGLGALAVGMSQTPYRSAVEIICELTPAQKQSLYDELLRSYNALDTSDLVTIRNLLTNPAVGDAVATTVLTFLTQQGYSMLTAA